MSDDDDGVKALWFESGGGMKKRTRWESACRSPLLYAEFSSVS